MIILAVAAVVLILLLFAMLALLHTIFGLILFLIVAGFCAGLAEYVLGVQEGVLTTVVIGLIGAALGVVLATVLHLPLLWSPLHLPVVWTIIGSLIVVMIMRFVVRDRRPHWI